MNRDSESEHAAARAVIRVVGGEYVLHDTGSEDAQYDVHIIAGDGTSIALEVTSVGGDTWKRTKARIAKESNAGHFEGANLQWLWWVILPTGIGVRDLPPPLEALLENLESVGIQHIAESYSGDDELLLDAAKELRQMRVNSVTVWTDDPVEGQTRILVSQSERRVGTDGALPAALVEVFAKGDNQEKLARAQTDERHLYVFMEDGGAGTVLEGGLFLPPCPADPQDVIDAVWIFSPSASSYLFRVTPGEIDWTRYSSITGDRL